MLPQRGIEVGLRRPNFVPIAKDGEHEPPAKWPNPNEVFPTCQDKLTNSNLARLGKVVSEHRIASIAGLTVRHHVIRLLPIGASISVLSTKRAMSIA